MSCAPEVRILLQRTSLFTEFSENELAAFLDLADDAEVSAGEPIVKQDEVGSCMYIITSGEAKVVHRKEGRHFELATLTTGDFFGELALVDQGPRSADVIASTDCKLICLHQSAVRALAGTYPSAAFKFLVAVGRALVARMRAGNRKYIDSLLLASRGKD